MSLIRPGAQCSVSSDEGEMKLIIISCSADLINVFEVFLPQLLRYPNPADPLNGEAAALLIREPKNYEQKVRGNAGEFAQY